MNLTESQRTELARAIAESDIADCSLENEDINALVDLFDAWLERSQTGTTREVITQVVNDHLTHSVVIRTEQLIEALVSALQQREQEVRKAERQACVTRAMT